MFCVLKAIYSEIIYSDILFAATALSIEALLVLNLLDHSSLNWKKVSAFNQALTLTSWLLGMITFILIISNTVDFNAVILQGVHFSMFLELSVCIMVIARMLVRVFFTGEPINAVNKILQMIGACLWMCAIVVQVLDGGVIIMMEEISKIAIGVTTLIMNLILLILASKGKADSKAIDIRDSYPGSYIYPDHESMNIDKLHVVSFNKYPEAFSDEMSFPNYDVDSLRLS